MMSSRPDGTTLDSGSPEIAEQGSNGRCVYCDERCNADARYHEYCRDEYETRNTGGKLSFARRKRAKED